MKRLPIEIETRLRETCPYDCVLGYGKPENDICKLLGYADEIVGWYAGVLSMLGDEDASLYACHAEDYNRLKDHFDRPWEEEGEARSPRFEDGKWYRFSSVEVSDDSIWKVIGNKMVNKTMTDIVPIPDDFEDWTPCKPDGSPIAPEPAVSQVWKNDERDHAKGNHRYTLCKHPTKEMYISLDVYGNSWTGWTGSPAEAVEGLTFVREADA